MIFNINKGRHWPRILGRLLSYGLFFGKSMNRTIGFYPNCKYDMPGTYDDEDVNKLFGVSFTVDDHIDSARVGWYYNSELMKFILVAYCYVNKRRIVEFLGEFNLFDMPNVQIDFERSYYRFTVKEVLKSNDAISTIRVSKWHRKTVGYKLGVYFGGNNVAPHDMKIKLHKL